MEKQIQAELDLHAKLKDARICDGYIGLVAHEEHVANEHLFVYQDWVYGSVNVPGARTLIRTMEIMVRLISFDRMFSFSQFIIIARHISMCNIFMLKQLFMVQLFLRNNVFAIEKNVLECSSMTT